MQILLGVALRYVEQNLRKSGLECRKKLRVFDKRLFFLTFKEWLQKNASRRSVEK
jgi:hypothetical protein